jgi:hypothetical protein
MDTKVITKHNKKNSLADEDGSAMVIALIVLAVLTIIGIFAINTSTTELQIVRNEQIYQINFYQAESSAYQAAQRIELETNSDNLLPRLSPPDWINDTTDTSGNPVELSVPGNWVVDDVTANDNSAKAFIPEADGTVSMSAEALYAAISKGVRKGSSLDIAATRLYEYAVFGQSQSNNGSVIVEIGYLKRF